MIRLAFIADGSGSRWTPFQIGTAGANGITEDTVAGIAREVATLVREGSTVGAADRVDGTVHRFHQRFARHGCNDFIRLSGIVLCVYSI